MRCPLVIVVAVLMAFLADARGYTCYQGGIGPVLVADGRVYFSQADESLTTLDLATGAVIARTRPDCAGSDLLNCEYGIVRLSSRDCALLDRVTLGVIWERALYSPPQVRAGKVVGFDRPRFLVCRDLRDGQVLWSHEVEGENSKWAVDELVVSDTHVVLFRPGVGEERVAVCDLASGENLATITPEEGQYFLKAFLAGDRVYVASGSYDDAPKAERFTDLLAFSVDGRMLSTVKTPPEVAADPYFGQRVVIGGVEFSQQGVRQVTSRPVAEGSGKQEDREYRFEGGVLTIRKTPSATIVSMRHDAGGSWRGFLPYLDPRGQVRATVEGDRVLLASNFGHLECVDATTGRSLWMYTCPTIVAVGSYSWPNGMPPRLTARAEIFRQQNANRSHLAGLCLIPDGAPDEPLDAAALLADRGQVVYPTLIADPTPFDPYADLPELVRVAWSGELIALAAASIPFALYRWRWSRAAAALVLPAVVVGLSYWLPLVCRISDAATLSIKLTIITLLIAVPFCVLRAVPVRRPWGILGACVATAASAGWCWHLLTLLRYG